VATIAVRSVSLLCGRPIRRINSDELCPRARAPIAGSVIADELRRKATNDSSPISNSTFST
jgi:hypothetical protein